MTTTSAAIYNAEDGSSVLVSVHGEPNVIVPALQKIIVGGRLAEFMAHGDYWQVLAHDDLSDEFGTPAPGLGIVNERPVGPAYATAPEGGAAPRFFTSFGSEIEVIQKYAVIDGKIAIYPRGNFTYPTKRVTIK